MNHISFVLPAYGVGILIPLVLGVAASRRLQRVTRRLLALDPRTSRRQLEPSARQQDLGAL